MAEKFTKSEQNRRFKIILFSCLGVGLIIILLVFFIRSQASVPTSNLDKATTSQIQGGVGKGSKEYNKKLRNFDTQKATKAEKSGDSYIAIPGLEDFSSNDDFFSEYEEKKDDCDCNCYKNCKEKENEKDKKRERKIAYDKDGNVIGYIDENGNVVDFKGNIIGKALANGTLVDKNGKIIGNSKQPIYDKNGNLIGFVDKDGNVIDANGNIIGQVRSDGTIVDSTGKVIGEIGEKKRQIVYDENGNIIGYVDENGNVIGTNGKIIGKLNPDGTVVDINGKVIGKVKIDKTSEGQPVYDKNGNLIGFVDKDGNVVGLDGKVIGKMNPDGTVVDKDGKILGSVQKKKQLAYDADGKVIGYVDENGNVVGTDGKIIGKVRDDGTIIGTDGKVIGTTTFTPKKEEEKEKKKDEGGVVGVRDSESNSDQQEEEMRKQAEKELREERLREEAQKQAKEIAEKLELLTASFAVPTPGKTEYVLKQEESSKNDSKSSDNDISDEIDGLEKDTPPAENENQEKSQGAKEKKEKAPFKPGDILFAAIDTAINSDVPSPVLASILSSGEMQNAKLLGEFSRFDERMILTFNSIILPDGRQFSFKGYAVDPKTTEASVASSVDTHFLQRWGGLIAASFIEGFGEATKNSGAKTGQNSSGDEQDKMTYKDYSIEEQLLIASGKVGKQVSKIFEKGFTRPPTVFLNPGEEVGILILEVK